MFEDKIMSHRDARDFANMTRDKKRKKMSNEILMIWMRWVLKRLAKPEFYILMCINLSKIDFVRKEKIKFGHMIDDLVKVIDGPRQKYDTEKDRLFDIPIASECDKIINRHFPTLLRKCYLRILVTHAFIMRPFMLHLCNIKQSRC